LHFVINEPILILLATGSSGKRDYEYSKMQNSEEE
jgi:hypothetical protein